jgi:hypothetical protein
MCAYMCIVKAILISLILSPLNITQNDLSHSLLPQHVHVMKIYCRPLLTSLYFSLLDKNEGENTIFR